VNNYYRKGGDYSMGEIEISQKIFNKLREIKDRYERYSGYLHFPYEWGERALRGWLIYEIFHEILEWPIKYIVLGEQFDVLFVDEYVKPRIYLETKKPGKGLADIDDFKARTRFYGTLRYAVITDGDVWGRYEASNGKLVNEVIVDINKRDSIKQWGAFFIPLHAKGYLYEVT
jgi:hypothetical protein